MSLLLSEHKLGWKFLVKICRGASAGLEYLHSHNLIHRDIKARLSLRRARAACSRAALAASGAVVESAARRGVEV